MAYFMKLVTATSSLELKNIYIYSLVFCAENYNCVFSIC